MIVPIAHSGHWLVNLLYVAPLFVAVAVLGYQSIKDRRQQGDGPRESRRPPEDYD